MAKLSDEDLMKLDLYSKLGILSSSNQKQITSAYRKKALECHPDKNPNNAEAENTFIQLKEIHEFLLDDVRRKKYDDALKVREELRLRDEMLNFERRNFKRKLEEQEQRAFANESVKTKSQKLYEQLNRDGDELVLQKQEEYRKKRTELYRSRTDIDVKSKTIVVRWNSEGKYNEEILRQIFSKHGNIEVMIMKKKKKKAIIEFTNAVDAKSAALYEKGFLNSILTVELLGDATNQLVSDTYELNEEEILAAMMKGDS